MKEITFEDVIEFIVKNSDETARMDKLNKLTFPFTSKYTMSSGFKANRREKPLSVEELEKEVKKPFLPYTQC